MLRGSVAREGHGHAPATSPVGHRLPTCATRGPEPTANREDTQVDNLCYGAGRMPAAEADGAGKRASPRQSMLQLLVAEAVWLVGGEAESLLAAPLVDLEVAFADVDVTISLEGDDVRRQSVEEPAVVGDHHH